MLSTKTGHDDLRVGRLGFTYDYIVPMSSRNFFDVSVSQGIPGLFGGTRGVNNNASRDGAGGQFLKFNVDYTRIQKMPFDSHLIFRATGQLSDTTLPSSETIAIGGSDSVRGFNLSEYVGDYGYTASAEWRIKPPFISEKKVPGMKATWQEFMQVKAFVDYGSVYIKNPTVGREKYV
jgi:hemolysin activation/secretion protein